VLGRRRVRARGLPKDPIVLQLLTRIFGSRNQRLLRQYARLVTAANVCEPRMQALSDAELAA